jgi:hypothetical protein
VKEVQVSPTNSDAWTVVPNATLLRSNPESSLQREASSYTHISDNVEGPPESREMGKEMEQAGRLRESENSGVDSRVAVQELPRPEASEYQTVDVPIAVAASETQNVPMRDDAETPLHLALTEAAAVTLRTPRSVGGTDDSTSNTFTPQTIPSSVNDGKWNLNLTKRPASSVSAAGPLSWPGLRQALGLNEETVR